VVENSCILDLQLGVKINPATGCTGRGNKEEEREGSAAKCTDITIFFIYYIKKHSYVDVSLGRGRTTQILLFFVVDVLLFAICYTVIEWLFSPLKIGDLN
jgi:hypothetical protein